VRWLDLLGFAAAATVLAGFCMNTIINLRMMALASNLLFVVYGLLAQIYPVALLHLILLPVNLLKLRHIRSQACSAEPQRTTTPAARPPDLPGMAMGPHDHPTERTCLPAAASKDSVRAH
jgi:hypothetical protein